MSNRVLLKSFTVENSHCFGDSVTLDMSAPLNKERLDKDGNPIPELDDALYVDVRERKVGREFGILPIAAIYGKNASGKSSFLKLLGDIAEDILLNVWRDNPSAFKNSKPSAHVIHNRISFVIGDCEYELKYSKAGSVITTETFTVQDLGEEGSAPMLIYDRCSTKYETLFPLGEKLAHRRFDENWLWFTYLYWREDCGLIHSWMNQALSSLNPFPVNRSGIGNVTFDFDIAPLREDKDGLLKKRMLHILNCFDPSIVGMEIIKPHPYRPYKNLEIRHKLTKGSTSTSSLAGAERLVTLLPYDGLTRIIPLEAESSGVQRLATLLPYFITALEEGSIYVCDGLDKDLHPIVFKQLVRMFSNPEINKNNAQLIFTAHDTIALNSDSLRRDEVHIVDKDENLVSVVNRLDKFTYVKPYPHMEFDYRTGYYYSFPEEFWQCHHYPEDEVSEKMIKLKFIGYDGRTYPVYEDQEKQYWKDVNLGKGIPKFLRPTDYGGKRDFYGEPEHPLTVKYEVVEPEPIRSPYLSEYKSLGQHKNLCISILYLRPMDVHLYSEDRIRTVISEMKKYWHMFPEGEKPNWCTLEQIEEYERLLLKSTITNGK